jgi:hypothetical protein
MKPRHYYMLATFLIMLSAFIFVVDSFTIRPEVATWLGIRPKSADWFGNTVGQVRVTCKMIFAVAFTVTGAISYSYGYGLSHDKPVDKFSV